MTEHSNEHKQWADRLKLTPEFIAIAEQITGQPIADLMTHDAVPDGQMEHDAMKLGEAMARHDVSDFEGLAAALTPSDDEYAELHAALQRAVTILLQDADSR